MNKISQFFSVYKILIIGLFCAFIGAIFLAYSYKVYEQKSETNIWDTLKYVPEEKAEFLFFYENKKKIEQTLNILKNEQSIYIPDSGIVIGYKDLEEKKISFLSVEKIKNNNSNDTPKECQIIKDVLICGSSKIAIAHAIDSYEKKEKNLYLSDQFLPYRPKNAEVKNFFIGKTPFLKETLWDNLHSFIPPEEKELVLSIVNRLEKKLSHIVISDFNSKKLVLTLIKKEKVKWFIQDKSTENIFRIPIDTLQKNYLFIKNPSNIGKYISTNTEENYDPEINDIKYEISNKIEKFFEGEINTEKDVLPFLSGSIGVINSESETSIIAIAPTEELAQEKFDTFKDAIFEKTKRIYPLVVSHILKDGSEVKEIFPNDETLEIVNQSTSEERLIGYQSIDPKNQSATESLYIYKKGKTLTFSSNNPKQQQNQELSLGEEFLIVNQSFRIEEIGTIFKILMSFSEDEQSLIINASINTNPITENNTDDTEENLQVFSSENT